MWINCVVICFHILLTSAMFISLWFSCYVLGRYIPESLCWHTPKIIHKHICCIRVLFFLSYVCLHCTCFIYLLWVSWQSIKFFRFSVVWEISQHYVTCTIVQRKTFHSIDLQILLLWCEWKISFHRNDPILIYIYIYIYIWHQNKWSSFTRKP